MHQANTRPLALTLCAAALAAIGVATLWPLPGSPPSGSSLCLACGELGGVDLVLNVVLFFPLGVALAHAWPRRWWIWVIPTLASLTVEILQLRLVPGRDASLGDLVSNTTGGLLGIATMLALPTLLRSTTGRRVTAVSIHLIIVAFSCIVAWTLLPAPVVYVQWVQIQPERAGYETFPGRVAVSLFEQPREVGTVVRAQSEPPEYSRGDLSAELTITEPSKAIPTSEALIFRLANPSEMRAQVSQRHDALAVRFKKRGNELKLRSPTFVLDGVFPVSGDSLRIQARSEGAKVHVTAASPQSTRELNAAVTFGRGWEVFSPFRAVKPSSEPPLRWSFLALLFAIPAAFSWVAWRTPGLVVTAIVMTGVLALLPKISGLAASAPDEWTASVTGVGLGAAAGLLLARWFKHEARAT